MLVEDSSGQRLKPALGAVMSGSAVGLLLAIPAIFAAVISSGAGHGHYVAARALFPTSMLLTLLEGSIGVLSVSVALLQFPVYGGLVAWGFVRKTYIPAAVAGSLHLVAALVCFAGTLPNFS
ncbi:hypothetical protein [Altererythrobacter sp. Root672]|uniref:hypothetical protein n=1 Tax=Altererythrobacter sp. Root672 TaxID=1736584 RepID=UPI0006FA7BDA|nr:hypothetical protein [Altererythrobacter sp. Root672]KRA83624.1 hypothetical protein ASD76_06220 [Altererythrobacter sp. Root672]